MMGVKAEFLYPERAMESNHMKANPRENSKLAGKKVTRGKFSFLEGGQDRAHRALREGSPSPALRLCWGRLSRIHPGRTDPANSRGGSWGVRPALGSHLCHLGLGAKQGDPTDGRGSTGAELWRPNGAGHSGASERAGGAISSPPHAAKHPAPLTTALGKPQKASGR